MARHRRPVNVRDDGLTAVLGPLVTVAGVERAVLLDVDSGMVLDAWACGEAADAETTPGGGAERTLGLGSAQSEETVPGGATFGAGHGAEPGRGDTDSPWGDAPVPSGSGPHGFGGEPGRGDAVEPGGGERPGFGAFWRSLRGADHPAGPRGENAEARGDVEAFGARHADLVRALLALPGTPPAELSLVVDDRHHLLRCVADPAGGRLALAVVVAGSPWVVRRVRRHLRQLPDAGLTTGPWLLTWSFGPPATPWPPPEPDGPPAPRVPGQAGSPPAEWPHDAWPASPADEGAWPSPDGDGMPLPSGEPWPEVAHDGSDDPEAAVPDPRRGPAPPSALPPARSAGGG